MILKKLELREFFRRNKKIKKKKIKLINKKKNELEIKIKKNII